MPTSIYIKLQKVKGLIHFNCYYYCFSSYNNAVAIWNIPATNSIPLDQQICCQCARTRHCHFRNSPLRLALEWRKLPCNPTFNMQHKTILMTKRGGGNGEGDDMIHYSSLLPHWVHVASASLSQRLISSESTVHTVDTQKHTVSTKCNGAYQREWGRTIWTSDLIEHFLSFSFKLWLHLKIFLWKQNEMHKSEFLLLSKSSLGPGAEEELTSHVHYVGDQLFFVVGDLFELWQTHKELQQRVLILRQVGQLDETKKR